MKNKEQEIKKLVEDLGRAAGKFPVPANEIPREFKVKIADLLNIGVSGPLLSEALGLSTKKLSHWKYAYRKKPVIRELKIKPEIHANPIAVTITRPEYGLVMEGLNFSNVQLLLKGNLL